MSVDFVTVQWLSTHSKALFSDDSINKNLPERLGLSTLLQLPVTRETGSSAQL